MDQKASSSSKAIFSIRSPLAIFTPRRTKDKDQISKSPKTPSDPIKEPLSAQQKGNKTRPKKKDSQTALPSHDEVKESSHRDPKPIIPGNRRSEDLGGVRIRYSLFSKSKEKTQSMPGLDEKFLEGFTQRAEQNKIPENRRSGRGMASRISSFFNKFIPSSPRKKDSLSPDSKTPDTKKQIKRVTFAINVQEAENPDDITPPKIDIKKRRGTARPDEENIPPIFFKPQQKHAIDYLTIPIEHKRYEKSNEHKEINSRDNSPNIVVSEEKGNKKSKKLDLETDFQPYGFINSPIKLSPVTPSTSSSLNAKPNQLTPINLANVISRNPSDSGSFSPAKEKFALSPVNLLPIKSSLIFNNKARRNSALENIDENNDNFDFDAELNHGAKSQRNIVMGTARVQTFNQRVSEVRSSLKLPALPNSKKILA